MILTPGTRLGPYELTAQIGEGGMGEVYRATDTKLKRQVAIKILPPSLAADGDRLTRFQREAEVLASLNHPNIAAIYGLEESDHVTALVMELVEGEDLSQRIARGALPITAALRIARQIAEALEAAHEEGIIHRDLKPANIKVRSDGTVKVLDFGLAKSMDPTERSSPRMSVSPTITIPAMTQVGMILGTAAYMSPEQASGTLVDRRSDLWAFGVVLLEMLTGRPVFEGETMSHVLAAVLTKPPDWTMLPVETPAPIRTLLRRCLEKDRKRRLADASDARLEIEEALTAPVADATPTTAFAWFRSARLAWAVAAGVALAASAIIVPALQKLREAATAVPHVVEFEVVSPSGADWSPSPFADTAQVALSPDGRHLAFVAGKRGEPPRVWIRPLDRIDAQPLAGTEGATFPFWSPDGRFVAFFASGKLKKIAIAGGAPQTLCDVEAPRGGSWSPSGVILFARGQNPLAQVSSNGGTITPATRFDAAQEPISHYWPQFFPDGVRFLYLQRSNKPQFRGLYVGSLASPDTTLILATEARGLFAQGHLLFVRDGLLFAQTFDERALRLGGQPERIADHVGHSSPTGTFGYAAFDASASGAVVFGPALRPLSQLNWFDRTGHLVANGPQGVFQSPRLSFDQKTVAVTVRDAQTSSADIWVFDGTRGTKVTTHPAMDWFPTWMPDGAHLLFASTRDATKTSSNVVYRTRARGMEDEEPVNAQSPVLGYPNDVSPDGKFVLAHRRTMRGIDIFVYPLAQGGRELEPLSSPFNKYQARFSPDGKWVAHASDESGRFEVYVRPFPFSTERTQVSTAGGMQPEWRRDGKELYFISADRKMMAVSISTEGTTPTPGTAAALFPVDVAVPNEPYHSHYAVSANGQRFLVNSIVDEPTRQTLTVILDWQAALKK